MPSAVRLLPPLLLLQLLLAMGTRAAAASKAQGLQLPGPAVPNPMRPKPNWSWDTIPLARPSDPLGLRACARQLCRLLRRARARMIASRARPPHSQPRLPVLFSVANPALKKGKWCRAR